jgi:hypothetical protein
MGSPPIQKQACGNHREQRDYEDAEESAQSRKNPVQQAWNKERIYKH